MAQPCSGLTTTTKLLLAAALLGLGCWYMLFMPDIFENPSTRQTVPLRSIEDRLDSKLGTQL